MMIVIIVIYAINFEKNRYAPKSQQGKTPPDLS